jgi:hypothetical protein
MLVHAFHAALEDRIEAFNRIGADLAANVFLLAVIDRAVCFELAAKFDVVAGFPRTASLLPLTTGV